MHINENSIEQHDVAVNIHLFSGSQLTRLKFGQQTHAQMRNVDWYVENLHKRLCYFLPIHRMFFDLTVAQARSASIAVSL